MLISKQKPLEEILSYLEGDKNIFLIGCKGCAEGWESGGEKQVAEMKSTLQEKGKTITGSVVVDMLCDSVLTKLKLRAYKKEIAAADSIMVLTDGAGVQTVAELVNKVVHPGCNTLSSGGAHAEWKEAERCLECGDCVLEFTGGLCPIARCSKHLLNGPCGGSQGGKCEVDPNIPCVWQQIVDRLAKLGQLDKLERLVTPKNWSVSLISGPPVKSLS
ncbi:MAG: methylenetetrahydrofolate reductase C-terminal domain-containing protein [Dehalococcoidia bacterium]|nr:methylenetetrahydrofolate reductase C-terminal domain-containing protein [Dehalococcoidia bacterium]